MSWYEFVLFSFLVVIGIAAVVSTIERHPPIDIDIQ